MSTANNAAPSPVVFLKQLREQTVPAMPEADAPGF